MILVNPEELKLGCSFADKEHSVIANALNAIAKALSLGEKDLAFNSLLPNALDYLEKHLTHEERVLENAFLYWAEEMGLGDLFTEFFESFRNFLRERGKDLGKHTFGDFVEFLETFKGKHLKAEEFFQILELIEHQKSGHQNIIQMLKGELSKIDPSQEPKRIIEQLGVALSFVLNRVLKMDRKYVEFYKKYDIPACEEKPILPPAEVLDLIENLLKDGSPTLSK
jgi:hemerythrin